MKNGRKKSFYVFLIIFLCAVAVGIGYTVKLQSEKKKYEDLAKEAHVTEMATRRQHRKRQQLLHRKAQQFQRKRQKNR